MTESTSKVMLLALSQTEVSLLRLALQELIGVREPKEDLTSIRSLLQKIPGEAAPAARQSHEAFSG